MKFLPVLLVLLAFAWFISDRLSPGNREHAPAVSDSDAVQSSITGQGGPASEASVTRVVARDGSQTQLQASQEALGAGAQGTETWFFAVLGADSSELIEDAWVRVGPASSAGQGCRPLGGGHFELDAGERLGVDVLAGAPGRVTWRGFLERGRRELRLAEAIAVNLSLMVDGQHWAGSTAGLNVLVQPAGLPTSRRVRAVPGGDDGLALVYGGAHGRYRIDGLVSGQSYSVSVGAGGLSGFESFRAEHDLGVEVGLEAVAVIAIDLAAGCSLAGEGQVPDLVAGQYPYTLRPMALGGYRAVGDSVLEALGWDAPLQRRSSRPGSLWLGVFKADVSGAGELPAYILETRGSGAGASLEEFRAVAVSDWDGSFLPARGDVLGPGCGSIQLRASWGGGGLDQSAHLVGSLVVTGAGRASTATWVLEQFSVNGDALEMAPEGPLDVSVDWFGDAGREQGVRVGGQHLEPGGGLVDVDLSHLGLLSIEAEWAEVGSGRVVGPSASIVRIEGLEDGSSLIRGPQLAPPFTADSFERNYSVLLPPGRYAILVTEVVELLGLPALEGIVLDDLMQGAAAGGAYELIVQPGREQAVELFILR